MSREKKPRPPAGTPVTYRSGGRIHHGTVRFHHAVGDGFAVLEESTGVEIQMCPGDPRLLPDEEAE